METLMDEVCGKIRNYFVKKPDGIHRGKFTISDGNIECDFLAQGQYFRVVGSVFNDGVWRYPAVEMVAEQFDGEVWGMCTPPAFLDVLKDIEDWNDKFGGIDSVTMSPFQSESFNNYSYTKASGSSANGGTGTAVTWESMFANRLSRWRKICL